MAPLWPGRTAGQAAAEYLTVRDGGIMRDLKQFFDRAVEFGQDHLALVGAVVAGLFILRLVMKPRTH